MLDRLIPLETPEPASWALQHAPLYSVLWVVAMIAVFAPLAVRRYRSATSR
jgi:hypothetical protein